jgi:hypothetical protein
MGELAVERLCARSQRRWPPSPPILHLVGLQRVIESDLPDLLPLLDDYCRFNGVERTHGELLIVCRALIADPDHEGLQIIARAADGDSWCRHGLCRSSTTILASPSGVER